MDAVDSERTSTLAALLGDKTPKERVKAMVKVLLAFAQWRSDAEAKRAFELLLYAIQDAFPDRNDSDRVLMYLVPQIYWQLCDYRPPRNREAVLLNTKMAMCSCISWLWKEEKTEQSIEALDFLIAAHGVKHHPLPKGASHHILKSERRDISREEREGIVEMVRTRLKDFSPEGAALWIEHPFLPEEFWKSIAHAWAINGGHKTVAMAMKSHALIKAYQMSDPSDEATVLLRSFAETLTKLDGACEKVRSGVYWQLPDEIRKSVARSYYTIDQSWNIEFVFELYADSTANPQTVISALSDLIAREALELNVTDGVPKQTRVGIMITLGTNSKFLSASVRLM